MIFGKTGEQKEIKGETQQGQAEGHSAVYWGHTQVIRPA
jgi:hypothetical protein